MAVNAVKEIQESNKTRMRVFTTLKELIQISHFFSEISLFQFTFQFIFHALGMKGTELKTRFWRSLWTFCTYLFTTIANETFSSPYTFRHSSSRWHSYNFQISDDSSALSSTSRLNRARLIYTFDNWKPLMLVLISIEGTVSSRLQYFTCLKCFRIYIITWMWAWFYDVR